MCHFPMKKQHQYLDTLCSKDALRIDFTRDARYILPKRNESPQKSTESPTSLLLKIPYIELSQSLEPSRNSEKISHQFI